MKISSFIILAIIILTTGLPGFTQQQMKNPDNNVDAVFNFIVTNLTGKPQEGDHIMLKNKKTAQLYQGYTGSNGKCSLTIPAGHTYIIYYRVFTDTVKYNEFECPAGERMAYTLTIKYEPPKKFTLKNIYFETASSNLTKDSYPALNEFAEVLKRKKSIIIEISGHTDNIGSPANNQKLSADRASAVRGYLVKQGIDINRIKVVGYGDSQPIATNDTPEGRQKNRRTEIRIISQ